VSEPAHKGPRTTQGPRPIRRKKLFERPWPWIILAGLIVGAVFALGTSMLRTAQDAGGNAGDAFVAIVTVGVIAVVLMALVAFYSARKRRRTLQEHLPGTMMAWLKGHVWIGLAALIAVLVHVWLYPITSSITTGKITLAILIVLVLSGIAWRIVYQTVPRRVPDAVGNLSTKDTRSRLEQVEVEIEKTTAGVSDELRELAELRLAGRTNVGELDGRAASLSLEEQATWEEIKRLADRRDRYRGREPKQEHYQRLLQRWKVIHLPLAVILGAAIAIHVADVLGLSDKVSASETDAFPDSAQCADCHSDIVDQWKTAMHAIAQKNPTVVAQTALALQKYPDFKRVCTNCHAPIGTQITNQDPASEVFPLPGEDGGAAVLGDGVNCWTCHALPNAPTEIQGAFDDFPVDRAGSRSFGLVFAPPLDGNPLPVPNHQVAVGFMTGPDVPPEQGTYQLCGACHNVKVDIDGNGLSILGDDQTAGSFEDTDENGTIDQNDLQFEDDNGNGKADLEPGSSERDVDGTNKLLDLVLQTTFDEWQDYTQNDPAPANCGTCHMPSLGKGATVNDGPANLSVPDRPLHSHEFVGVDYDLEPGHYESLGVGDDARTKVLNARDELISEAATLSAEVDQVDDQTLTAAVTVRTGFIGHDFPTGFAFARQWWLEVKAVTQSGEPVCLVPVNPATGLEDEANGIPTKNCSSGSPTGGGDWNDSPAEDLLTCDPRAVAQAFGPQIEAAGLGVNIADVVLSVAQPLDDCDPWLTNFQKILTDGDPEGTGRFLEVPYQSLLPDIVKLQTRVATQQLMIPLKSFDNPDTPFDDREATFAYVFDTSKPEVLNQKVKITFALHLRHLPPYFIRELGEDPGYPEGLTSDQLLSQMVVSTAATDSVTSKRVLAR